MKPLPARLRLPMGAAPLLAALVVAAALAAGDASAQTRPNFLFIALDDLVPMSAGNLDDPSALLSVLVPNRAVRQQLSARLTPNMNRLASRGVTFTHAWTSYPLCNASRSALLTGIAAARSRYVVENKYTLRDRRSQLNDAVTLPQRLKQAGYSSLGLGKIFHFSEIKIAKRSVKDWPDIGKSWSAYIQRTSGTIGRVIPAPEAGAGRMKFGVEADATEVQPDWVNADLAATLLRDGFVSTLDSTGQPAAMALDPGRPFFLGIGLRRPHTPWTVPQKWLDLVPKGELLQARINFRLERADLADTPHFALRRGAKLRNLFGYDGTPRKTRMARLRLIEAARHYLAAVAFADACIGRVLDALEASPHAQNTVVVLWSDHGYSWGQKLHFGKSSLWEPSLRSEFLIADFRLATPGRRESQPVSLLDIYPTVCELAGISGKQPAGGDGESLARTLRGSKPPKRAILASFGSKQRAIRFGQWKYITYGRGDRFDEVYNLEKDPFERRNLLRNGARPAILPRLKSELHRITSRYRSPNAPTPTPGAPPRPPSVGAP